ncbi:MAG: DUF2764 family protein [Bacteroidales bacterium]
MSKNYYYLVSGLQDLKLNETRLKISSKNFRTEIKERLSSEDSYYFDFLELAKDNRNFLNFIFKKDLNENQTGVYSSELIPELIQDKTRLPLYLVDFLNYHEEHQSTLTYIEAEKKLTELYFNAGTKLDNEFISWYFHLEGNIRNILIWNQYKNENKNNDQIVHFNSLSTSLLSKTFKETDLNHLLDWYNSFVPIINNENILQRERNIDELKWSLIDQRNIFQYFSIDVLLAYYLKLKIAERWLLLDPEQGKKLFQSIIDKSKELIELPNDK